MRIFVGAGEGGKCRFPADKRCNTEAIEAFSALIANKTRINRIDDSVDRRTGVCGRLWL